jgi:hypothetical protein
MATKEDLMKMEDRMENNMSSFRNLLLRHMPTAAIEPFSSSVVAPVSPLKALAQGDTSTWSLVRDGGKVYALSCVHCALYYRSDQGSPTFVSIPETLMQYKPARVGFVSLELRNPLATNIDLVAVELGDAPQAIEEYPAWYVPPHPSALRFATVAGKSNAGYVTGENLIQSEDYELLFVEGNGEPGNSGTLMYGVRAEGVVPLGVYCGVTEAVSGMRRRGRICALRPPAVFQWLDVMHHNALANSIKLSDRNGTRGCSLSLCSGGVKVLDDTGNWPGVLINQGFDYCGSLDHGSCRAL